MKLTPSATVFKNDEDQRIAGTLFKIILAMLVAYLAIIGTAFFWGDQGLMTTALIGGLSLLIPLVLLLRGFVHVSGVFVTFIVLVTATFIATVGQGIHDLSIITYPVILTIASLILPRRDFILSSLFALIAMGWLVFGEAYGFFVSRPYETPRAVDYIIVAVILLIGVIAVDMLAESMRESMRQARQEISQRKTIEMQLRHQSIHDSLTGIYNRSFFESELTRLENSREYPISIVVADVDGLKVTNDTRGHAVGDQLLEYTAQALCAVFRSEDVLARIGGDEFAVLLPRTTAETAKQLLARVQLKLDEDNARHPELIVRLSLGTATLTHGKLAGAFIIADQNMYADKAQRKSKLSS
jgi:diguanylate cyclase (GGDEF)-like protein